MTPDWIFTAILMPATVAPLATQLLVAYVAMRLYLCQARRSADPIDTALARSTFRVFAWSYSAGMLASLGIWWSFAAVRTGTIWPSAIDMVVAIVDANGLWSVLGLLEAVGAAAMIPAIVHYFLRSGTSPNALALPTGRPSSPWVFWPLMVAGLVALVLTQWVTASHGSADPSPLPFPVHRAQPTTFELLWQAGSKLLLSPVIEESLFRGAMLGLACRVLAPWKAVVSVSIAFALMHWGLAGLPFHFLAGCLLGAVACRTNALWVPMLLHLGLNLSGYLMMVPRP